MQAGDDVRRAPDAMIGASPHAAWRQLAVLDRGGEAVAFTGSQCSAAKGELTATGVAVVGNGLANELVLPAIWRRFRLTRIDRWGNR
jgi:uncharacterized Ntn-hydrolase superfamily protein